MKNGIYIDHINGYHDHCHCLVSLTPTQNLSKIVQLLKGESSRWINVQGFFNTHFEWHPEYYAANVSPSLIDRTRQYIRGQEEHHRHKTFKEKYDELLGQFGLEKIGE